MSRKRTGQCFAIVGAMALVVVGGAMGSSHNLPIRCPIDGRYYQLRAPDQFSDAAIVASNAFWDGRRGQLAVIPREDVRQWVFKTFSHRRPGYVFVGARRYSDRGATLDWFWFTNRNVLTPVSMAPGNWVPGEPNNFRGRESALAMDFNNGGRLNDLSPRGRYSYLVQY